VQILVENVHYLLFVSMDHAQVNNYPYVYIY